MTGPGAVIEREWRRFTLGQRFARFLVYLGIIASVVVSVRTIEIIPEFLYDAPAQMRDLFTRMWPVDWAHYPEGMLVSRSMNALVTGVQDCAQTTTVSHDNGHR